MDKPDPPPPQQAPFIKAVRANLPVYASYVATTAASMDVDITARTPGYIEEILFRDGDDVIEGQGLYTIEYTQNQAEAEQARASLRVAKASYKQSQLDYERQQRLKNQDYVSEEDLERQRLTMEQNKGAVEQAQAQLTEALKVLSYTHIAAPFDGRLSRTRYFVGDLVGVNGQTILTSIVKVDPLYVYFNVPSTQLQHLLKARAAQQGKLPVVFSLKGDQSKQYHGSVDFIDNQVAEGSSTIQMRASVANHEKDLYPGQFGQIQLQLSRQNNVLLVPQAVVKQDIEGSYLFHIAQDNTLQRRNITLGDNFDSWVVVSKGIKEDDRIVSGHLMLMRNGIGVAPQRDDKYPVPKKIKALQKPVPTNTDQAVKQDS